MQDHDMLEQELTSLGTELREFPSVASAVMRNVTAQPATFQRVRRFHSFRGRLLLVAAAAVILAGVLLMLPGPAQMAFAQVLENARNADSVAFLLTEGPADSGNDHKCLARGTKFRVEHSSGIVAVGDSESRKQLVIDPDNNSAGVFDLHGHAIAELGPGIVEQLRQVRPDDAQPIGKETIDGKDTDVFRVRGIKLFGIDITAGGKGEMKVWVDPKSMLPWRIELRTGETAFVTLRELNWNVPVEPASLAVRIPDGYAEQPKEFFEKRLRPNQPDTRQMSPTEAFRNWSKGKN